MRSGAASAPDIVSRTFHAACRESRHWIVVVSKSCDRSFSSRIATPILMPTDRRFAMTQTTALHCTCGQVRLEVERSPIISNECHCNSCRAAGARLQALPAAPRFTESNGGTRFVDYRKDRIRFHNGRELLREFRLTPDARTRRVVASCCNTPVFLEFHNGHWLSLYGCLWRKDLLPPLELRTMTSDLPRDAVLPDDVTNAKRQSASYMARLLGAWIAMGFRSPAISIHGELHA